MPRGVPKKGFRMTRGRLAGVRPMAPKLMAAMAESLPLPVEPEIRESDDAIRERIAARFEVMDIMARATAMGENRAMIVSGPAGVGKSFGITKMLEELGDEIQTTHISGFVRATGLYKALYENRHPNCVVVFDDADSVFSDEVSLNLLKKACDTTKTRTLSWLAETKMADGEGATLPTHFAFEGSVIFITNNDFDRMIAQGSKLAPHFEALISRSHYLDLTLKSRYECLIRIKQVIDHGMLKDLGLTPTESAEVIDFMEKNLHGLRETSLRMIVKLGTLIKMNKPKWQTIARATCMR